MDHAHYKQKLEYLNTYRWRMREVESLRARIRRIEDQITAIRSPQITDMPRGGLGVSVDDLIVKKVDLLAELREDLSKAEDEKAQVYSCIRSADCIRDRTILAMHYVDCMSYAQIANKLGFSDRQIKRFCRDAIKNIEISAQCP